MSAVSCHISDLIHVKGMLSRFFFFQLQESNWQVLRFGINPNWIFFIYLFFLFVLLHTAKIIKKKITGRERERERESRCRVICAAAVALVLHINGPVMINRGCVMFLH